MRNPIDSYVPVEENDLPFRPPGGDRFRWLQWLQLGLSAALLVMFFNQLSQLQDANRRIARLYERMDALDQTRMLDQAPALSAQQALIIKRLQVLESAVRDKELEKMGSYAPNDPNEAPAALQPPPRP